MSLTKSGNPALKQSTFETNVLHGVVDLDNAMTMRGTLQKFGLMCLLLVASAFYSWKEYAGGGAVMPLMLTGLIGGLIVAVIIIFKKEWAQYLAPVYAILEGLALGAISAMYNFAFEKVAPNIVMTAVGLTFSVAVGMYFLYSFKIIRATEKFKSVIIAATAGIALFYVLTIVLHMFGVNEMPFLHEGSVMGIGFSLFVTAIAALNLILDFDMIETGAAMGAPKYMEWYGAFGLMITMVWLYLEILRLLSKISSRN